MMDSLLLYKILKNRTGAEVSASGNPAIMSDTLKNNPMNEMKVYGWSKQETTTGAQLFPTITPSAEAKSGITVEYMEHGKIHISGTAEKTVDFMTPTFKLLAGTYTLSMGVKIDNTLIRCTLSTMEGLPFFDIYDNVVTKTETIKDNMILYLLLRVYGGKTIDLTIQPMLNAGTSPLPWEPYTGGQPSPSPDYPQEIESAGAGGEVGITICGKNLFDNSTDISKMQYYKLPIQMRKGTKLTMSFVGVGTGTGSAKAYCHDSSGKFCGIVFYFDIKSGVNKYSSTIICNGGEERIYFYATEFLKFLENIYDIQIEINGTATDYEPYHTPQNLSISTPTGLPAIPVDADGNYTDADGQQWISDYVDLKRGKYVQNIRSIIIDGDSIKFKADATNTYWNLPKNSAPGVIPNKGDTGSSLYPVYPNNYFSRDMIFGQGKYQFIFTTKAKMKKYFASADDLTKFCAEKYAEDNPLKVYYVTEPIETDLTTEEIEAYKTLVTYAGTTVVENDAECYMEVSAGGGDSLRAKKLALILGE